MNLPANLHHIQNQIHEFEKKYHRETGSVKLLAVTKGRSLSSILELAEAGQIRFGENYIQEALPKIRKRPDLEWHFIGSIQANKTRDIAKYFSWVHSVADIKIAKRLNDYRPDSLPRLNICIQVNMNHEPTKSGVDEKNFHSLLEYCLSLSRLHVRGLMIIPVETSVYEEQRHIFKQVASLQKQYHPLIAENKLDTLSMGMSNDYEAAIAEGSTMVRIGRALFL
jgi:pyridoxal phosphate enzyme (YggS family)